MYKDIQTSAKIDLSGKYLKTFFKIIISKLSLIILLTSLTVCTFCLIFVNFKSFNMLLFALLVSCMENIILVLFWSCLRINEIAFVNRINIEVSLKLLLKFIILNIVCIVRKIINFILFLFPALVFTSFIYSLNKNSAPTNIVILLLTADVLIFFAGLISFFVYIKKYHLASLVILEDDALKLKDIFTLSAKKMNGKCFKFFLFKMYNLPKRLLSLLIFPAIYFLPYCEFSEFNFITEKPYLTKKSNTEKSVVFYLGKTTA